MTKVGGLIPSSLTVPGYRPDIDGLRAVAILAVVAYHAFPQNIHGGYIGVDVFFVISGYLISSILFREMHEHRYDIVDFYVRRLRRIFPSLLLVLISSLIFGWFGLLAVDYAQLGQHVASGAGFVSNLLLLHEVGYFDRSAVLKPLLHLWSLAIEEQFYIVWPLLLWLAYRLKIRFVIVTALLMFASIAVFAIGHASSPIIAFYSPAARGWELLAGAMLAIGAIHGPAPAASKTRRHLSSIVGLAFIMVGAISITSNSSFVIAYLLPVLGALLLIWSGKAAFVNRFVLSQPTMVWIGLISYPLYLWHWPLLSLAHVVLGEEPSLFTRALLVLIAFFLAWMTYRYVEQPLRKGGRRLAMGLCGGMVLTGCLGFGVSSMAGIAARPYNVVNRGVSEALSFNWRTAFRDGTCFLNDDGSHKVAFGKICSPARRANEALVVLWGDSHAASLYQGLVAEAIDRHFVLAQLTASGCPPILNFVVKNRPTCTAVNRLAFQRFAR
jgi:peptidoglycan/LPS O-acetylase OafA/YrhL